MSLTSSLSTNSCELIADRLHDLELGRRRPAEGQIKIGRVDLPLCSIHEADDVTFRVHQDFHQLCLWNPQGGRGCPDRGRDPIIPAPSISRDYHMIATAAIAATRNQRVPLCSCERLLRPHRRRILGVFHLNPTRRPTGPVPAVVCTKRSQYFADRAN